MSINGMTDGRHQRDDEYPEEYLASIKESGLPPHVIRLKVGGPIIALRNITKGVSNGTRMVVTKILNHYIKSRVVHGPSTGREVLITRVVMTQSLGSFRLQPDDQGKLWMKNMVYKEIVIDTYHHEIIDQAE